MAQELAYRKWIKDKAREFCRYQGFDPATGVGKSIVNAYIEGFKEGKSFYN